MFLSTPNSSELCSAAKKYQLTKIFVSGRKICVENSSVETSRRTSGHNEKFWSQKFQSLPEENVRDFFSAKNLSRRNYFFREFFKLVDC